MAGKVRYYESTSLRISYDVRRCIHAAECVRRLPDVFNPDRRPWVDPDRATADAIEETIVHCPTGALHYERLTGGSEERPDPDNTVTVSPDGPLYIRGRVRVSASDGTSLLDDSRVALCRCGASAIKPLCDGKHKAIGFQDTGTVREATG
ncbi:MAG: (4Fe-4S)-binding protein, partial [Gemmatimonadota bacterium]|nr:(4Fe-4S)-binding protein [Gemmatimonadota bacterium]